MLGLTNSSLGKFAIFIRFLHNKGCFESNFGNFSKAGQFQFAVFKTNPVPVGTFQNQSSSSLQKGNRSSNSPGARSKEKVTVDRKTKWPKGVISLL